MAPLRKGLLLIFTGAVGDLVSLSPAIRALARSHRNKTISVVVKGSTVGSILRYSPYVDKVIEFHVYERTTRKWWEVPRTLLQLCWSRRYSTAILTMGTGWIPQYRLWGLLLLYATGARRRIAFADECAPWKHAPRSIAGLPIANEIIEPAQIQRTARFMEMFEKAGLISEGEDKSTQIWNGSDDFEEAAQFRECFAYRQDGRPVVFVFPGVGSGPGKRWPEGRYIKVVNQLIEHYDARVFLDGTDRDFELCKRIKLFTNESCVNLAGQHSMGALVVLIKMADLVIASDSGPIHIAEACGTPAVVIFGPTDPQIWAPESSCVRVLRKSDCPPCNNSFFCHRGLQFACTKGVQTSDVIQACDEILAELTVASPEHISSENYSMFNGSESPTSETCRHRCG